MSAFDVRNASRRLLSLIFVFTVVGAAFGRPVVTGTEPEVLVPLEELQWVSILGIDFDPNSVVMFAAEGLTYEIPPERFEFVDRKTLRVYAGLFPGDVEWLAWVVNPDGSTSNRLNIAFATPPAEPASRPASASSLTGVLDG